ncbi:phosphopantetheine-binding protein, partial [Streptomyces alboverticillatus]|uniref:phosphopantetheine-binding protein n=1 Tax=Streptomyces alboverticillatus TaxID=173770 RepID=UPI0015C518BE
MIPSAVEFLERLPRTSSGKTDRKALAALAPGPGEQADAPDSTLESVIATAWRQLLGVASVAAQDDVFDLGAQSLQAIQAANRLGVELGREVKVAWLFQYPRVAELARFLGQRALPATPGLPPALLADTVLDPDIRPGAGPRPGGTPERVLLTGATGFVGVHLLAQLLTNTEAEIVCTVRA